MISAKFMFAFNGFRRSANLKTMGVVNDHTVQLYRPGPLISCRESKGCVTRTPPLYRFTGNGLNRGGDGGSRTSADRVERMETPVFKGNVYKPADINRFGAASLDAKLSRTFTKHPKRTGYFKQRLYYFPNLK